MTRERDDRDATMRTPPTADEHLAWADPAPPAGSGITPGRGRPRVCLGMPLYNQTEFLVPALRSLLGQTWGDFRLVVTDDSTSPEPGRIVTEFAAQDSRVEYHRNESRQGMIGNWREAFARAGPGVEFFAWVGDHDVWHPRWLEAMMSALAGDPVAVMAHPLTGWISDAGEPLDRPSHRFDTTGLGVAGRIRAVCTQAQGFGNMVYGLFRAAALRDAGVFRRVLAPDIMLLTELCLHGAIKQVDEILWSRRHLGPSQFNRQKHRLFVAPPWYAHLSWPIVNSLTLAWNAALRPGAGGMAHRTRGLGLALRHFWRWAPLIGETTRLGSPRDNWKRLRRSARNCLKAVGVRVGGVRGRSDTGGTPP